MIEQATTTTTIKQISFNTDEQEVFNLLIEYINDLIKYRQLVFYVGTSLDNKRMRLRLIKLHYKLYKSISIHSDKLKRFFANNLNDINLTSNNVERLFCFTLSTLLFFKSLIEKLIYLFTQFKINDENEEVVNLGFDDSVIHIDADDTVITTNENSDFKLIDDNTQIVLNELSYKVENLSNDVLVPTHTSLDYSFKINYNTYQIDLDELNMHSSKIHSFIEEIELMDTNLVRYNVNLIEANPFIKHIKEYNPKGSSRYHFSLYHHHHHHHHHQNKVFYSNNATNISINFGSTVSKKKSFKRFTNIKKYVRKKNFIISLITLGALFMIIVLFGLIFGLK